MPTKAKPEVKMFTAWSYSRWNDHSGPQGCPARANYKHLLKVPVLGPGSPAMARGAAIHKLAEDYVGKPKIKKLPDELKLFKKEFAALKAKKAIPEGKWAMTVNWTPTEFMNWTYAWCRVVLDAHYCPTPKRARVIDYKTGKIYGDNEEQTELYAIAGFMHYPKAEVVDTELWYLDQGVLKPTTYERRQLALLQKKWKQKVIPLLTDKKFIPRPGDYCGRCDYSKRKNGPCKF